MTSFTQIEKRALAHAGYGEHVRPLRDWFVLLALFVALLIGSTFWNVWMYERVVAGEEGDTPDSAVPTADTSALTRAQAVLDSRAAEEAKYQSTYQFVDPSK